MLRAMTIEKIVWISALACLVSVGLHLCALKIFPLLGLLDFPERYGHKRERLPYPTGVIPLISFLLVFASVTPWSFQTVGLVSSICLLGIISFVDDRYRLPSWLRLITQAIAAFLIFATGSRIYTITNPLGGIIKLDTIDILTNFFGPLPFWSGVFTIFWLMLTINALNWFDGIPGQVSTLSLIGFLTIGFLSLSERVNQPELALIAFVLAGISLGCFLFDIPPNAVLMGDTGAMFFGLLLGVLTIYSGGKVATAFLVLGVPLIDVFIVIARRIFKRDSIFRGNATNEHLHHRLLAKGWTAGQIITLTACIGSLFGITALFLSTQGKFFAALLLFAVMFVLSYYSNPKGSTR